MKFVSAVLDISAGETGVKEIPNQYPAISDLLGYIAITGAANTTSGELMISMETGLDVSLKNKRTITVNSNSLIHSGILVLIYKPAIDIAYESEVYQRGEQ